MKPRTVFFVSDNTGVTAETLGHSLIVQFDGLQYNRVTVPFISSLDKARETVRRINHAAKVDGCKPIVFSTLVKDDLRREVQESNGLFLDFFDAFLAPLEIELEIESSHKSGRAHGMTDIHKYTNRIAATNFALNNDDGSNIRNYGQADVILTGVSRSGKTPTCLYLALQYGIFAANFPLTEDELEEGTLPAPIKEHRDNLYGLTISAVRLQEIRKERRATGRYASPQQINYELRQAEALFKRHGIPYIDTTKSSIEEIASRILEATGIERRL